MTTKKKTEDAPARPRVTVTPVRPNKNHHSPPTAKEVERRAKVTKEATNDA